MATELNTARVRYHLAHNKRQAVVNFEQKANLKARENKALADQARTDWETACKAYVEILEAKVLELGGNLS